MTQTSPAQLNFFPEEVELKDLLDEWKKNVMLSINCHGLATVQSVDTENMTITATMNYKKTFFQAVPGNPSAPYVPVLVDYPILVDCPFVILGGGTSQLTFPIAQGDQCLVMFNDRDIDNWFAGLSNGPVATPRLHSFSDGLILTGFFDVTDYDTTRAVLKNKNAMVGVGTDKVKISNTDTTLNTLLQSLTTQLGNLCTALEALTVICASPGSASSPPVNVAAITAVASSLSSLATQIGGLLE